MTFIIQASQAFKHSTHVNTGFPERRMFYQMSKALSIQIASPSTTTTCQSERNGKEKGLCAVTHPVAEFGVPAAHLLEEREPGAQELLPRLPSPPAWLRLHSTGRWPLRSHPCPRLLLLHLGPSRFSFLFYAREKIFCFSWPLPRLFLPICHQACVEYVCIYRPHLSQHLVLLAIVAQVLWGLVFGTQAP